MGPDQRAGDDEPQEVGDLEFVQQQGGREDDDQNQEELENRVFERQSQGDMRKRQEHGSGRGFKQS